VGNPRRVARGRVDSGASMNKQLAAEKIRKRLEQRLANFLGCEVVELPQMKIGTLVHLHFLLFGDTQEIGGFSTTFSGLLQILSNEIVWDIETSRTEEAETPKVVVN
jgi:hypothetical protein